LIAPSVSPASGRRRPRTPGRRRLQRHERQHPGSGELAFISASAEDSTSRGEGQGSQVAAWAKAVLYNGLGQYAEALAAAESAAYEMEVPNVTGWALIELVEAAVRSRQPARARDALRRLSDHTIDGSDWAGGVEARSRALVSEGDAER
jgi:hypothetical protein